MCFSATASFGVALILAPVGIYCVNRALAQDRRYLLFALMPLAFALQQTFEGAVWLGLSADNDTLVHRAALGFLFFSHFFWLVWSPLAGYRLEQCPLRRTLYLGFVVLGALHGLSLYLPLLLNAHWLQVELVQHSISYQAVLLHDDYLPPALLHALYPLIIIVPLLLSVAKAVRYFGLFILLSLASTELYFSHTLISVWCFFAAVLSLYVVVMLARVGREGGVSTSSLRP